MIELVHLGEIKKVDMLPREVQETVESILIILDEAYGESRTKNDDGGYVIVAERKEDFKAIEKNSYLNPNNVIVEYADKIECSNGEIYINSLILCNNDYSISLITPLEITPENILKQM
ncbi:hypothetical protein ACQR2L_19220 (plasmid) [Clostridium butyricum]|uniref:hypothetical protein n=1 Tax=Clostridium butyricum TaxID=1492 RepID=UPI003D0D1C79